MALVLQREDYAVFEYAYGGEFHTIKVIKTIYTNGAKTSHICITRNGRHYYNFGSLESETAVRFDEYMRDPASTVSIQETGSDDIAVIITKDGGIYPMAFSTQA